MMPHMRVRLVTATVLTGLLTLGSVAASVGYIDQSQVQVLLSGPNVVKCNRAAKITARVVSTKQGKPIKNQAVDWRLANAKSGGDGLSAARTVTNSNGRTTVTLSFGPVAGARTVTVSASVTSPKITVRCAGGLPKTSTRPAAGFAESPSDALLASPMMGDFLAPAGQPLPATDIRMDRLGIDLPIVEGDGISVPEGVAAHYPGTAWPGQGSNTYVYAHAREGHFLELWQVRTGDLVEMDMADGSVAEYRVSEIRPVVEWDDLEYLAPTSTEVLTLQTCLTYADTAPRFVVIAERMPSV